MKRTTISSMFALVLVAGACSSSGGVGVSGTAAPDPTTTTTGSTPGWTPDPDAPGPVGFAPASLQQFGECSAFLDHVRREAADRVGPYGFDNGHGGPVGPWILEDFAFADEATVATEAPAATVPVGQGSDSDGVGRGVSGTNVQVHGVDEPDIVKTDGDRILALAGNVLHYVDIDGDGSSGTWRGSIALDDDGTRFAYGHEIFVDGDRAYVFAQVESYWYGDDVVPLPVPEPLPIEVEPDGTTTTFPAGADAEEEFATIEAPPAADIVPRPGGYERPSLLIVEVDLSTPTALRVVQTMTVDGRYISARATGSTARVVVTSPPRDLQFVFPSGPGSEDVAEQTNRDIVLNSTIEDWVPTYTLTDGTGATVSGMLAECGDIHAPAEFGGFDMLSIITLDLAAGLDRPAGTASVLASGETVYASQDRLYVATNVWDVRPFDDRPTEKYETALHRFDIAGGGSATYEASGAVNGHLLNQFSMNDRDGVLYVATTTGAPWTESTQSQIVALEMDRDRLVPIGVVDGLGHGERIYSVRYVDGLAYVVTFRETDPFYVVDLRDPRAMRVAGELKIPGYSSYLHPVGGTLVLGVGQDATLDGRVIGAKLSLFDVSDPANPVEVDVWTLPNASSIVEFDHRAFLHWAPTNTVVLPMQSYGDRFAGAIVFDITADGIVERGRITHADHDDGPVGQTDCRVLGADELGPETELFWIGQDGGQVQLCGPEDRGGAVGLFCEPIPVDNAPYFWNDDVPVDLTGVDRIELCWPDWSGHQVAPQRTMVIAGSLWTLSPERLQANDLDTLARSAVIVL